MATSDDFLNLIEQIPTGKVATYGMVANWAGSPGGGMAVGNTLRNRPPGRPVPWHRVVSGNGRRGYLSPLAPGEQRQLLEAEGVSFEGGGWIDLARFAWRGPVTHAAALPVDPVSKFGDLPLTDLLALYSDVLEEIKSRGISRGNNNPQADWAEKLVAKALNAEVQRQSNAGFDLLGPNGERYEVKSRRITGSNGERQLGAIRKLVDCKFDFLVGVLFKKNFRVQRAAVIPRAIVAEQCRFSEHSNSSIFTLNDDVWNLPGVVELMLDDEGF